MAGRMLRPDRAVLAERLDPGRRRLRQHLDLGIGREAGRQRAALDQAALDGAVAFVGQASVQIGRGEGREAPDNAQTALPIGCLEPCHHLLPEVANFL